MICPRCRGPAVRVQQTGELSCVRQCGESTTEELVRKELEGLTASLARLVGSHMPRGFIFTLILSTADDGAKRPGAMAYASSGQRPDIVSMLREMADKLESGRSPS